MTILRFYSIDPTGHIRAPAEEVECANDADALGKAAERTAVGRQGWFIEVWDGARCVGRVTASADSARQASYPVNETHLGQPHVPTNRTVRLWDALRAGRFGAAGGPMFQAK